MAGDWIKMRAALADDPRVITMATRLGCSQYEVVGLLHAVWSWADQHTVDGHAPGVTLSFLASRFCRQGLGEAMRDVGWLEALESGLQIPDFDKHNGESAKKRALAADRKRKSRAAVPTTVTPASRTQRDQSVTREEKRREEEPPQPPKGGRKVDKVEPAGFAAFWAAWPQHHRKVDRAGCLAKWVSDGCESQSQLIVAKVEGCKTSHDWVKDGGAFIPSPRVWLNQRRYDAPVPTKTVRGTAPTPPSAVTGAL